MKKEEILKKIEQVDEQIKKFKKRLKTSDLCEDLYDNAILQKAILMKELEDCNKNPIVETFKSSVRKLMQKGEKKLICDYFKG